MCFSQKESIIAFILIVVVVIVLWYRNYCYDRLLAAFLFVVGLVQLVEYLRHRLLISPSTGGRLIFIILWLQTLVLAIGTYLYLRTPLSLIWAIAFSLIFLWALYDMMTSHFSVHIGSSGHMEWTQNGSKMLGSLGWLYLAGLFVPFLLIQCHEHWRSVGLWILLAVTIIAAIAVYVIYPNIAFPSLWCYAAVAVAFTAYLIGAFPPAGCS